jgi:hypothetical protein
MMVFAERGGSERPGNPALGHRLQVLAKGVDGPINLINKIIMTRKPSIESHNSSGETALNGLFASARSSSSYRYR